DMMPFGITAVIGGLPLALSRNVHSCGIDPVRGSRLRRRRDLRAHVDLGAARRHRHCPRRHRDDTVVHRYVAALPAVTYYNLRVAKEGTDIGEVARVFD